MSREMNKRAAESSPPLLFLPESQCNFPVIPLHLKTDSDYISYKRECELHLAEIYSSDPEIPLAFDVSLSILRANIAKRFEHAKNGLPASVPDELLDSYASLPDHGFDLHRSLEPDESFAPYFNRLPYLRVNSIEVGFRFAAADTAPNLAFDTQQVGLNSLVAYDFLGARFPDYILGNQSEHKITRIIGRAGHYLAVIKTKQDGARLVSADGKTELRSRGRRTGVVDLHAVGDEDVRTALRVLAGAGADKSMRDDYRDQWKAEVRDYLLGKSAAYHAVFERFYFTREESER